MVGNWQYTESSAIPRWKIGLWIWRVGGEWRFRLYRPWQRYRMIETQSEDWKTALYFLGLGAGWWTHVSEEDRS